MGNNGTFSCMFLIHFFIVLGALFLQALNVLSVCKNAAALSLQLFLSLGVGNVIRLFYFGCKLL